MLSMLETTPLSPPSSTTSRTARTPAQHPLTLLNDILDLGNGDGKLSIKPVAVELPS